jgi:hypothetical protein
MRRVTCYEDCKEVGDWYLLNEGDPDKEHFCARLPEPGGFICLPIRRGTASDPAHWLYQEINGQPDITPSIFCNPPTGWHGFIKAGVITRV